MPKLQSRNDLLLLLNRLVQILDLLLHHRDILQASFVDMSKCPQILVHAERSWLKINQRNESVKTGPKVKPPMCCHCLVFVIFIVWLSILVVSSHPDDINKFKEIGESWFAAHAFIETVPLPENRTGAPELLAKQANLMDTGYTNIRQFFSHLLRTLLTPPARLAYLVERQAGIPKGLQLAGYIPNESPGKS
jgi:hypothetical protein